MKIKAGSCVIVSLRDPREKFWGVIEEINAAGIFIRGLDLGSYEELLHLLARGEEGIYPASVFFPLLRVERIVLDETTSQLPSLRARFEERTGIGLTEYLGLDNQTPDPV